MDLTDAQWAAVERLLPKPRVREDGRGRPWRDPRDVLNGVLWILRTGAPWKDLPERYPPRQTCHRRFQSWCEAGALGELLRALARDLQERGGIDMSVCFVDGSFVSAKKGGDGIGKTKRGKGTKIMAMSDRAGLPVAADVASASPHEVTLVERLLEGRLTAALPKRLVGDRAYDSDPLDERLRELGVERVAPHRKNRVRPATQDAGPLEAYGERWKLERLFA